MRLFPYYSQISDDLVSLFRGAIQEVVANFNPHVMLNELGTTEQIHSMLTFVQSLFFKVCMMADVSLSGCD